MDLDDLLPQKAEVLSLATAGVILSTLIVGGLAWLIFRLLHSPVPLLECLLFGALISPTDPIAVLGLIRTVGANRKVEALISGESLFNDGIGIIVFIALAFVIAHGGGQLLPLLIWIFVKQVLGGLLLGLILGLLAYRMLKSLDEYKSEILITLALVMGGYTLAEVLGSSGPLAMVVSGLLIGNHGRAFAMSKKTREYLDVFWEMVDSILNALLFILMGLEILVLEVNFHALAAAIFVIPAILLARWLSVAPIIRLWKRKNPHRKDITALLTWGGLRGGIAIALALSLPEGPYRNEILSMTYLAVLFSILIQGLTIERMYGRLKKTVTINALHEYLSMEVMGVAGG